MKSTLIAKLSLLFVFGALACGKTSQKGSTPTQSSGGPAASGNADGGGKGDKGDKGDKGGGGDSGGADVAAAVASLEMKLSLYSNATGKIVSGYDGQNKFFLFVPILIEPDFSKGTKYTAEQIKAIMDSEELSEKFDEVAKKITVSSSGGLTGTFKKTFSGADEKGMMAVFMADPAKAGTGTVKISLDGKDLSAALTIGSYTPAQVTLGGQRYSTAVAGATPSPACASCHLKNGKYINNSSQFIYQFTDDTLLTYAETGMNPDTGKKASVNHKMSFETPEQRAAIAAYLRTLPLSAPKPATPGTGDMPW